MFTTIFTKEYKGAKCMYGVIDIGSNTMRLNIYEYKDNEIYLMLSKKITAGLAGYVNKKGNLSKKGITKAVDSLKEFKMILDHIDINETYTFATASLRNVNNSKEATKIIEEKTNLDINVISGEEEASLGYVGASMILTLEDGLLVDIGGGSTELVLYEHSQITKAVSLPIGSLSLYNKYVSEFLPTETEMKRIKKKVLKELKKMDTDISPTNTDLIWGVGGTVRATRKINNEIYNLPEDNNIIKVKDIQKMFNYYLDERYKFLKDLIKTAPDRLHTILPGMIILEALANYYGSDEIQVSDFGVREGYLLSMVNKT